jgi:hypothetical protein
MVVAHEPARLVGADRHQRQRQLRVTFAHAAEAAAVGEAGVADAVDLVRTGLHHEARP